MVTVMKKRDDGGSVYPALAHYTDRHPTGGITLRDHFAGLAITGMAIAGCNNGYEWNDDVLDKHTKMAYRVADSMIRVRTVG